MKRKSILLIGCGKFGGFIAEKINELGHELMIVDSDEERLNSVMPFATNGQIGDSTKEEFLKYLDVPSFDVCIVTIGGDFQSSLETTCLLKELGAKKVVSRAERDGQAKFLLKNGADEIVYPEKQLASWMAIKYTSDHILDYIELDDEHAIFEVDVPESWIGKSIIEIDIRKKFDINILAIKENGKMNVKISPNTILSKDKTLLVIGEYKAIQKCFKI